MPEDFKVHLEYIREGIDRIDNRLENLVRHGSDVAKANKTSIDYLRWVLYTVLGGVIGLAFFVIRSTF